MPCLDVLVLYEDYGTGCRAKRSLDLLPNQFPPQPQLSTRLWKISLLADPVLREQAVREAAAVDMIILSLHGRSALPHEVRDWFACWLGQRQKRPCAFGLLLDSEAVSQGSDNPVIAYVQQVAATAGADLFYGFSEAPANELDSVMAEIGQRAHQSSAILEDMLKRAEPHRPWGINE